MLRSSQAAGGISVGSVWQTVLVLLVQLFTEEITDQRGN